METLPQGAARVAAQLGRCRLPGLLLGMLALVGCVHDGQLVHWTNKFAGDKVCQVVSTWNRDVRYTPDPTHGGRPVCGLVGRIYLFGQDVGAPLMGDGTLVVDLYDDTDTPSGAEPRLLEEWRFDAETLCKLQKRDIVGYGYSLFLPWGTYRPGLTSIHYQLCYKPAHGMPIWSNSGPITLENPVKGEPAAPGTEVGTAKKPAPPQQTAFATGGR